MKYYKKPKNSEKVRFNLNDNKNTIFKVYENRKLDFMLRWVSENFDRLKVHDPEKRKDRWLEADFVTYRGTFKTLLSTPYDTSDGFIICASKFKGTIYLCAFDTPIKLSKSINLPPDLEKCTQWGHKFEQYMLSDNPNTQPNLSIPFNENEEFCCIFKSKLGEKKLLYGGQIDGISSQQQIQDTLAEKEVKLIELKTSYFKSITHDNLPYGKKGIFWWCQSYLSGIDTIVVGLRNVSGIVTKIKEIEVGKLTNNSMNPWNHKRCLGFLNGFLNHVKNIVVEDYDKCFYKFTYQPHRKIIEVNEEKPDPKSEYTFLNSSYINKAKEYFE
ncbi:decapping and exoribonuclease protein-like [Colletes latitarsis]|uniref:decapping and exoribonuclease protein-like n=1 Tax=Colletes latitarsis TaxID=2605962 RepID=UPI004036A1CF